jgi:hypothetical protein
VPRFAKRWLLDAIQQRSSTQLYSCTPLLEELTDVLTRPSATKRLALIDKTAANRKHLLPLGSHAGIAIVDVAEALRLIRMSN